MNKIIKELIFRAFIKIFVLLLIVYLLSSFTFRYYLEKASIVSKNISLKIKYLTLASKFNPLDSIPYYELGKLYHYKAISLKNIDFIKKSLHLLYKSKKLQSINFYRDFLIIDNLYMLGKSNLWHFIELKKLYKKYPNNMLIEKKIIEKAFKIWKEINLSQKKYISSLIYKLLDEIYWLHRDFIYFLFINENDINLILNSIPKNKKIYYEIPYLVRSLNLKIDYKILKKYFGILYDNEKIKERIQKYKIDDKIIGISHDKKHIIENGHMYWRGEVFKVKKIQNKKVNILIEAKSSICNSIPSYFTLYINDKLIDGVYVDSENEYKVYSFPCSIDVLNQNYLITISYENDMKYNNEDRNLYIKSIAVNKND